MSSALYIKNTNPHGSSVPEPQLFKRWSSSNSSGMDPDLEGIIGERCSCLARSLLVGRGGGGSRESEPLP